MINFILRHADRTAEDRLSLKGRKRAELLARMLGETGVSVAYRSDATRAEETLAPLKRTLGTKLQIKEIAIVGSNGVADHVEKIIADIRGLPENAVVIVVGHSNTIGSIVEGFGGRPGTPVR